MHCYNITHYCMLLPIQPLLFSSARWGSLTLAPQYSLAAILQAGFTFARSAGHSARRRTFVRTVVASLNIPDVRVGLGSKVAILRCYAGGVNLALWRSTYRQTVPGPLNTAPSIVRPTAKARLRCLLRGVCTIHKLGIQRPCEAVPWSRLYVGQHYGAGATTET